MLEEGEIVSFVNNKSCKVHGVGTTRLKMFNDCEFLLHNIRFLLWKERTIT